MNGPGWLSRAHSTRAPTSLLPAPAESPRGDGRGSAVRDPSAAETNAPDRDCPRISSNVPSPTNRPVKKAEHHRRHAGDGSDLRSPRIGRSSPRTAPGARCISSVPGSSVAATAAITSTYSRITSCCLLDFVEARSRCIRPERPSCSSANPLFSRPSSVGSTPGPHSRPRPSASREDEADLPDRH